MAQGKTMKMYQIDAFSARLFSGKPAAMCCLYGG